MMLRHRGLWALLFVFLVGATGFWGLNGWSSTDEQKEPLMLMSSIDLRWGEAEFGALAKGEGEPDPLYKRLSETHEILPVDNVAQLQASQAKVAMLVQPRPFTPEELVRLDQWVRAGGRLLFFADPALQWPSDLPIGDPARPLFTSMHSPLFAHWGVELVLPIKPDAQSAEETLMLGQQELKVVSAGQWQKLPAKDVPCRIAKAALVAECRPGKGQAILVADADLLHSSLWLSSLPGADSSENMEWVEQQLGRLAQGTRVVGQHGEILD